MSTQKVFLSYAQSDRNLAQELARTLTSMGIETLGVDSESARPGDTWVTSLSQRLEEADAVIPLISKAWTESPYAFGEIGGALSSAKLLIPVVVDSKTPMPALLAPYVNVDLSNRQTREAELNRLAKVLLETDQDAQSLQRSRQVALLEEHLETLREASQLEDYREIEEVDRKRTYLLRFTMITLALITTTAVVAALFWTPEIFANIFQLVIGPVAGAFAAIIGYLFGESKRWHKDAPNLRKPDSREVRRR